MISLRHLTVNQKATIKQIRAHGELARRIRDLGIIPGIEIKVVGRAPLRDPVAIKVRDSLLTLRNNEADFIDVEVKENGV